MADACIHCTSSVSTASSFHCSSFASTTSCIKYFCKIGGCKRYIAFDQIKPMAKKSSIQIMPQLPSGLITGLCKQVICCLFRGRWQTRRRQRLAMRISLKKRTGDAKSQINSYRSRWILTTLVKTTIFLNDMALFGQVNEIYNKYFTGEFPPGKRSL